MLWRMAGLYLILYIRVKGEGISGFHEVLWWQVREAGESKGGNLRDWIKSKTINTYFFYIDGYGIVNSPQ